MSIKQQNFVTSTDQCHIVDQDSASKERLFVAKKKTKYLFGKNKFMRFDKTFRTAADAIFVHFI